MGMQRARPSQRDPVRRLGRRLLRARRDASSSAEGLDPLVTMEVFTRQDAVLCGIDEAKNLLGHVLADADPAETRLEALDDGDASRPRRSSSGSGRATAGSGCTRRRSSGCSPSRPAGRRPPASASRPPRPNPVISFGARHVHPDITDVLDYAAIVGGCVGASTPAGARLAGLAPDRHDAPLAGPDLRRHGRGGPRVRPAHRPGRAADRPRRHVQGRGRGGAPGRPRARRPAVRHPPRHAVGARPGHRRPRPRGPGAARPGRLPPRQDRRLGRPDPRADRATSRRPARRSTRTPSGRTSAARRRSTSPATSRRSTARRSPSAAASPA